MHDDAVPVAAVASTQKGPAGLLACHICCGAHTRSAGDRTIDAAFIALHQSYKTGSPPIAN
jgi:hypothetical protein